ncbi:MAG TPA: hypothetical protein DD633_01500 [Sphaerochaeta sp.]|jgi:hypothetical protein|uniref:hypothetical protein n=1 Tax=Sphaerochaeta sp. UBA5849 TaxID=1947475 RepID=UPI000E8193BF|nr:hypothetical protein [Sphaerochaeta sp.]
MTPLAISLLSDYYNEKGISSSCEDLEDALLTKGLYGHLALNQSNGKQTAFPYFSALLENLAELPNPMCDLSFLIRFESSYESKERYPALVEAAFTSASRSKPLETSVMLLLALKWMDEEFFEQYKALQDLFRTAVKQCKADQKLTAEEQKVFDWVILKGIRLELLDSYLYLPMLHSSQAKTKPYIDRLHAIEVKQSLYV